MSDALFGYSIAVMAVIMLVLVMLLSRQLRKADVANDRARRAEKSLAVVRETLLEGRTSAWRRPPVQRYEDPDATQVMFRDPT